MAQKLRVAIVDDHPMFRAGVVEALSSWAEFEIVGEAATADEAVELVRRELPEVLLLDLGIPGSGLKAAGIVNASHPSIKVVILTSSADEDNVHVALKAGARGYVLKGVGGRELIRIIEQVMAGGIYVSPPLADNLPRDWNKLPRN